MGGALPTFSHSEILKAERKALVQRVEHLQQYQTAARMFKARRPRPPRSGPFFCCLIIFGDEVVESFRDLLGFGRKFSKRFHLFDNAINRIIGNAIAGCFHSADFWRRMIAETAMMLASFHFVGAEIVLILAVGLTLFGARNLPELARGLGQGMIEFRRATKRLTDATDKEAGEAGRSVGGIYGTQAAQALTPDNQVAELYDPAVLRNETQRPKRCNRMRNDFTKLWFWMRRFARRLLGQH